MHIVAVTDGNPFKSMGLNPFKMNDDSCALASILTWGLLKNQCFFLLVSVTLENKIKIPRFGSALVPACAATFFFPQRNGDP